MILASCYDTLISRSGDFCSDRQTNRRTKLIALPLVHVREVIISNMSGVRGWQQISRAALHCHGVTIPFVGHFMYTLAAHWSNWLVLGGTKAWHHCLISLAIKTLPNRRTDVAAVGMEYGFVLWVGVKTGVFAERNCWFIEHQLYQGVEDCMLGCMQLWHEMMCLCK